MYSPKYALVFVLLLSLYSPVMAQNVIRKKVPAAGETFKVKLKAESIYIVDPLPNEVTPIAQLTKSSCRNAILDDPDGDTLQFFTTIQTANNPETCVLHLRVLDAGDSHGGRGRMTFVRARKVVEAKLTSDWKELSFGKGNWSVYRLDNEMRAEIDQNRSSDSCRKAHDGAEVSIGMGEDLKDNNGQWKYGITNWSSWIRVLDKKCALWLRSLDGNRGRLRFLKLAGKPGSL